MTHKRSPSVVENPTKGDSPLQQKQRMERDDKEKLLGTVSKRSPHPTVTTRGRMIFIMISMLLTKIIALDSVTEEAEEPHTNRGRSESVWKILTAYGFCRSTSKGKIPLKGPCQALVLNGRLGRLVRRARWTKYP
jgi:hypothetical protein